MILKYFLIVNIIFKALLKYFLIYQNIGNILFLKEGDAE